MEAARRVGGGKGKSRNWHLTTSLPSPKHTHTHSHVLSLCPPLHLPFHCLSPCYQRRKRQGGAFWCGFTHWMILGLCDYNFVLVVTHHASPLRIHLSQHVSCDEYRSNTHSDEKCVWKVEVLVALPSLDFKIIAPLSCVWGDAALKWTIDWEGWNFLAPDKQVKGQVWWYTLFCEPDPKKDHLHCIDYKQYV